MPESIPQDLLDLRARLEAFLGDEVAALLPNDGGEISGDVAHQIRERSRAHGFFSLMQPREYGGQQAGILAKVVVWEAIAAANSVPARLILGPGPGTLERATGPLRERLLEPVLRGEKRGAFAFTEPSGPDAPERPTWAVRDGDDLLITGRKSYVSGGATSDFYTVLVNVDASEGAPAGTAMVVVDRDTPGVTIDRRFSSLDGGHHVELRFDQARVSVANVLGKVGDGMQGALRDITDERLELSATACGLMQWTVRYVVDHITAPHPSGNRLGDREGVRLRYSDLQIQAYAARSVLYRTARLAESGENAMNEIMAAKVFCTETLGTIVDGAVQLTGGQALVSGHPLEALYRRVRSLRLAGGASDVLRLNVARGRIEFGAGRV
jgi:acyl-CoA dehydrogenase